MFDEAEAALQWAAAQGVVAPWANSSDFSRNDAIAYCASVLRGNPHLDAAVVENKKFSSFLMTFSNHLVKQPYFDELARALGVPAETLRVLETMDPANAREQPEASVAAAEAWVRLWCVAGPKMRRRWLRALSVARQSALDGVWYTEATVDRFRNNVFKGEKGSSDWVRQELDRCATVADFETLIDGEPDVVSSRTVLALLRDSLRRNVAHPLGEFDARLLEDRLSLAGVGEDSGPTIPAPLLVRLPTSDAHEYVTLENEAKQLEQTYRAAIHTADFRTALAPQKRRLFDRYSRAWEFLKASAAADPEGKVEAGSHLAALERASMFDADDAGDSRVARGHPMSSDVADNEPSSWRNAPEDMGVDADSSEVEAVVGAEDGSSDARVAVELVARVFGLPDRRTLVWREPGHNSDGVLRALELAAGEYGAELQANVDHAADEAAAAGQPVKQYEVHLSREVVIAGAVAFLGAEMLYWENRTPALAARVALANPLALARAQDVVDALTHDNRELRAAVTRQPAPEQVLVVDDLRAIARGLLPVGDTSRAMDLADEALNLVLDHLVFEGAEPAPRPAGGVSYVELLADLGVTVEAAPGRGAQYSLESVRWGDTRAVQGKDVAQLVELALRKTYPDATKTWIGRHRKRIASLLMGTELFSKGQTSGGNDDEGAK